MQCKVCKKETESKFCELHGKAYRNIVKEYDVWKKASDVSWKEYLSEIANNSYTGLWAKEMVEYLMKSGEK
jgi:hypothetical protein